MKPVDEAALAACSLEPIHMPGAIQPHGALLVLREQDFVCVQVSTNIGNFIGGRMEDFLHLPLDKSCADLAAALRSTLDLGDPTLHSPVAVLFGGRVLELTMHRSEGGLIVEVEHAPASQSPGLHRQLQKVFAELSMADSPTALYQRMARFIAEFTGFERVMVYRFDADWHGEVVGEHLLAPVDSYFGHHFPSSDIPDQARALYQKCGLRIIPDSNYVPVPLEPTLNPQTGKPLDLSSAFLRSVSPVHLEYLHNMNVGASMSIALVINGRLWGLLACHHRTPRVLSSRARSACEIFGQVASREIAAQQETRRLAEHVQASVIQTKFFDIISQEESFVEALIKYTPTLLEFMGSAGAAIHVGGHTTLLGQTPAEADVAAILSWVESQPLHPLLATDSLSALWPEAMAFRATASGLLAIKLSRVESHYVLWFRPEVITTVTWAGNPEKPLADTQTLHPRKSFAAWQETVRGKSLPWNEAERQGARELVQALNALVLRRTERLIGLNAELERKNTDLNSFAYIAAHDLKEPLRGIANYCTFMREDHANELTEEALRKLDTMTGLINRSEELLDTLNHFSRIGRIEISRKETDLHRVVDDVLVSLGESLKRDHVEIRRPTTLPVLSCDRVLVREVFANLIANAVRYNKNTKKWVEIGYQSNPNQPARRIFYVKDNGIGIPEKHFGAIFHIFRRLHVQGTYGSGTGAGLAIVKSIIEKHGGTIWIESAPGEGSTFFFTLTS